MKIKRGDIYYIELYLEPGKISDYNRRDNGILKKISSKETYLLDIVPDEARQHILHVKQKYGTLNLYQQINVDVGGKGYEKRI